MYEKYIEENVNLILYNGTTYMAKDLTINQYLMGSDNTAKKIIKIDIVFSEGYILNIKSKSRKFPILETFNVHEKSVMSFKYSGSPRIYQRNEKQYVVMYFNVCVENGYNKVYIKSKSFSYGKNKNKAYKSAQIFKNDVSSEFIYPLHDDSIGNYVNYPKHFLSRLYLHKAPIHFFPLIYDIDIDPYLLGLWLGDGTSKKACITNIDKEVIDYLYNIACKLDCKITKYDISYSFSGIQRGKNKFLKFLQEYDLFGNKHVPREYIYTTVEERLSLLAGFIDTDGSLGKDRYYEILQKSDLITEGIVFIARSLGFYVSNNKTVKKWTHKGEKKQQTYNHINICTTPIINISSIPVLIERKIKKNRSNPPKNLNHYAFELIKDNCEKKFYKITIEGSDHTVLTNSFMVI